ncbi:DUF3795 domain-containing protein [bacterium]|nr:DUF3795 domain-containing protein [bacterium]
MDVRQMTAPCGRDCFNCPIYLAGENPRLRSIIAKKMNLPEERIRCSGCRNEKGCIAFVGWTSPCSIHACAEEKGAVFCFECADFPCDRLHPVADRADSIPHNLKVFNLCLIKKMGLETWAAEKAKLANDTYMRAKLSDIVHEKRKD